MSETFLCDYCRVAINPGSDSSLFVAVHRRVDADEWSDAPSEVLTGQELAFRYCSQQHAGQHLERVPLPLITTDDDVFGFEAFVAIIAGLGVLALAAYGGVQFWQEIASGWF